ncbi:Panacea domain-containing protein [Bacillus paranthracis]|uniref:DUF4065 domain-containing protein n=1 Tax=Bacillus paranthracis TaxID=2026186 RepID=A0A5M9GGD8_9BACI|nr:type II toxin-antitoxin system antitoxin SocA domain-containing protein [Bacillus paranthracis]KXI44643.1 hypothetical protein ACS53_01920 [Bacillus cereus]KAA8473662.1 DUF4065 domain-containing protein [Bacillus paranthracis]MCC2480217.1 DUF4065 domain-containing protein [Bacillus paranthracis]MCM0005585.1 DUF4065 domain-containing protein [Bacillus paranthracis]MCU5020246.1 DUF4065 domain-containing protein [Bacillus paranthracis]
MPNVFDVSRYFLDQSQPSTPQAITPLKLQKLVYYAQGWSLALLGDVIFDETIQAWRHGPVVPDLYQKFKNYGYLTIPRENFNNINEDNTPIFTKEQIGVLSLVWQTYGNYDGKFLEELTHRETPWRVTNLNNDITVPIIRNYFQEITKA